MAFLDLDKWSFNDPKLRLQSIEQVEVLRELTDRHVARKIPKLSDDEPARVGLHRNELLAAAEQRVFTALVHGFLRNLPTRIDGRRVWTSAIGLAPRRGGRCRTRSILVDREVGREFVDRFRFERNKHELRDGGGRIDESANVAALTVFGYLLEGLGRDRLQALVDDALKAMPELQEVVAWSSESSSPSPSSQ